jgi:hypothetical protein
MRPSSGVPFDEHPAINTYLDLKAPRGTSHGDRNRRETNPVQKALFWALLFIVKNLC